jgi:hypothetical protein
MNGAIRWRPILQTLTNSRSPADREVMIEHVIDFRHVT